MRWYIWTRNYNTRDTGREANGSYKVRTYFKNYFELYPRDFLHFSNLIYNVRVERLLYVSESKHPELWKYCCCERKERWLDRCLGQCLLFTPVASPLIMIYFINDDPKALQHPTRDRIIIATNCWIKLTISVHGCNQCMTTQFISSMRILRKYDTRCLRPIQRELIS